jgi:proteasome lid subunit RPN8/RPN11
MGPRRHPADAPESRPGREPGADIVFPASMADLLLYCLRAAGRHERGGVLLGRRDAEVTRVTMAVFPPQLVATPVACSFDVSCIEVLNAAKAGLDAALTAQMGTIVGWVHSHPGIGPFLSMTDAETLSSWRQLDPRAVAVVADPYLMGGFRDRIRWWHGPGRGHDIMLDPSEEGWLTIDQVAQTAAAITSSAGRNSRWDIVTAGTLMAIRVPR